MTQAELIAKIGFGCAGDREEILFRAGYRPIRPSPFNNDTKEFVSWTPLDRSAEEEGIAFWRSREMQSGSRHHLSTSDATMRGEDGSGWARTRALRNADALRWERGTSR
ncbi:MAG: hypothetical protein ACO32I_07455 [Candidatus Limnocylindrus sp.]